MSATGEWNAKSTTNEFDDSKGGQIKPKTELPNQIKRQKKRT